MTNNKIMSRSNFSPKNIINNDILPISSNLIIYSRSGHMVQKYNNVNTIILPKSVDINSIFVINDQGEILSFSYIPETNIGINLTDRNTGEKVEITVTKDSQNITGKVISLNDHNVLLSSNNKLITIRNYDKVIVNVADDNTRPKIILDENKGGEFTISYLLSNISWKCMGTALILNDKMFLRLTGSISNNTETDMTANLTLVSGDVYQNYRYNNDNYENVAPRALAMTSSQKVSSKSVNTSMLEDYVKYNVGKKTIHNKDIAELGTLEIPVNKIYIHETRTKDTVNYGYRFIAPQYIPACDINVYNMMDGNVEQYNFMGTNSIDESQKDDKIDLIIGNSTMLSCKSVITTSKIPLNEQPENDSGEKWYTIKENLLVEIKNHNSKESILILKHYVGNKEIITTNCNQYKRTEDGFIEFTFNIPANTEKETFSCEISTAQYM